MRFGKGVHAVTLLRFKFGDGPNSVPGGRCVTDIALYAFINERKTPGLEACMMTYLWCQISALI